MTNINIEKIYLVDKKNDITECTIHELCAELGFSDEEYDSERFLIALDNCGYLDFQAKKDALNFVKERHDERLTEIAKEIIEDEIFYFTEEDMHEVVNINQNFGDTERYYENLEEYTEYVNEICEKKHCERPEKLIEGKDFVYGWKKRVIDAVCDGEHLTNEGYTDDDQKAIERVVEILEGAK